MTDLARRTHVKRIFGMSSAGEDRDVYIDVEYVDEMLTNIVSNGQMTKVTLSWDDTNQSRQVSTLLLTDPANPPIDPNNPDVWIPINIIDSLNFKDQEGRAVILTFDNSPENIVRQSVGTRVMHWETNVDDLLNDGGIVDTTPFDGGDGGFMPNNSYSRVPGTVDESTYIDVEMCRSYRTEASTDNELDTDHQQAINTVENRYISGALGTIPDGTVAPPVRLDPLQNIVNVQWNNGNFYVVIMARGRGPYFFESEPTKMTLTASGGIARLVQSKTEPVIGEVTGTITQWNTTLLLEISNLDPKSTRQFAFNLAYSDIANFVNFGLFFKKGHKLNLGASAVDEITPITGGFPPAPGEWNDPAIGSLIQESLYSIDVTLPSPPTPTTPIVGSCNFFIGTRKFINSDGIDLFMPQMWSETLEWGVRSYRPKNTKKVGNFDTDYTTTEWTTPLPPEPPPVLVDGFGAIGDSYPVPNKQL